ncbi:MAG TPA: class I SAM-dependent methyltransferase [Planctomycetota bacterium]|nr:class I SAM-dependent methyltransferase [Planctomycetota bacterium]
MARLQNLLPEDFAPILAELGIAHAGLQLVDPAPPPPSEHKAPTPLAAGPVLVGQIGAGLDIPAAAARYRQRCDPTLPPDAAALFFLKDRRTDGEIARWRNALWPWLHLVAIYRIEGGVATRETLDGRQRLEGSCTRDGVVLACRRREHVLSPRATVEKFDRNAPGWNGVPGAPGYAHFRWMRRYVGRFAPVSEGARILDFGCGAGWVGIEAALAAPRTALRAFDPSPAMVGLAVENAQRSGLADFAALPGFGEDPPFPRPGEAPFDLVISSGVASFAPDLERWLDGLARTVRPGGTLVVGDLDRDSRGMRRRRAEKPLLPAREMNAPSAELVRARLEARGFCLERQAGYQLTYPLPQAMHWSDTRARGWLTPPLLFANRLAAGRSLGAGAFDSFVLRMRAGERFA